MNQIHEKDWAEDDWGGHSGMRSDPYDDEQSAVADGGSDNAKRPNGEAGRLSVGVQFR